MTKARDIANAGTALTSVSATELGYLDGVTSAVQTQLDNKVDETGGSVISANSSGNALEIRQTGAGNALVVEDETNPDATPFAIAADGKVAIGSTTPTQRLSLHSTDFGVQVNRFSSSGGAAGISFRTSRSGTVGTQTTVANGESIGRVNASASDGTAFVDDVGEIRFAVDNTVSTGVVPTRIEFHTTNSSGTKAERMRISADGATTVTYTNTAGGAVRNIYMSTSDPSGGSDGDVWIKYTA